MIKRAVFVLLLLAGSPAGADTWAPPSTQVYVSPDGSARLTVVPRELDSALAFFGDKLEGREPAGAPADATRTSAIATLERRGRAGRWQAVWQKPLINEVALADVVVANGGQGFATLDNWYSMGHGPDAVAIYDREGALVRQFALQDLFPDWFVAALPHSTSSIQWRGEPRIEGNGILVVPVALPSGIAVPFGEERMLDVRLRLADGAPLGLRSEEWRRALVDAAAVARTRCAVDRERILAWNAPIAAPSDNSEEGWDHYLGETQYRTRMSNPDITAGFDALFGPITAVLRPPGAAEFEESVTWLEEVMTVEADDGQNLRVIGSPDMGRLAVEIERIATGVAPGQLKPFHLVIVADGAHASRIRAALAHSGATLEFIDPKRPIPQAASRMHDPDNLAICRAPPPNPTNAAWWHGLPFLALGGAVFLLRRA
ncbi:MAG: hypothetical protein ACK4K7_02145 [Allosphingosinicella sp.]|uniref:hypothetical protein n=1 Tax=Allosphingosinicella sp. TaxID=2823234 RepID=UPI003958C70B